MFYFIPVKINRRRYFVAQLRHNNTHTHHFIIRKDHAEMFSLFNVGREWKHLYNNNGPDKEVVLQFRAHAAENTLAIELLDKKRVEQVIAAPPPVEEGGSTEKEKEAAEEDDDDLKSIFRSLIGRRSTAAKTSEAATPQTILNRESLDELTAAARRMGFDISTDYVVSNRTYGGKHLNLILQYTDEESNVFRANLCFHFQREDSPVLYHMLDFGSEASQIARCYTDHESSPAMPFKIVEELEKISGLHQPGTKDPRRRYYLQDEMGSNGRQETLYSSKIFIRRKNAVFSELDRNVLFHNNVNDTNVTEPGHSLVNMLTDSGNNTQLRFHYNILPNLKILSFTPQMVGNLEFENITVEMHDADGNRYMKTFEETNFYSRNFDQKIYCAILNTFLYVVVNKVKKYGEEGLLDLNILVPNIYGQHKVAELYRSIETDLPEIIRRENLQNIITGFEIHIISESDASFLGMMNERFFHEQSASADKQFLVVDSGKGTTDFSIIRKTSAGRYDSIYRSGIPGAGNVITYAFLETAVHAVTSNREKVHMLRQIMAESTTLSERLSISEALEQIKRNYSTRTQLTEAEIKEFVRETTGQNSIDYASAGSIGNLITILERISRAGTLADQYGYIQQAVNYLSGEVMNSLAEIDRDREMRFNRVFLSGRAFLFEPFKNEMIGRLVTQKYLADAGKVHIPANLKDVCIRGSVKGDRVNFDSGIIGLPLLSAYFNKPAANDKKAKPNFYQKVYAFISGNTGNADLSSHVEIDDHFFYKHPDHNINLKHFGLDETNRILRFKIGRYSYKADFSGNDIYEWNLLFNGQDMVFKDMTVNRYTVPLHRETLDEADRDTCFKSLMPYISNHDLEPPVTPYAEPETPKAAEPPKPEPVIQPAPPADLPFNKPPVNVDPEPPKPAEPPKKDNDINELYNFL